MTRQLITSQSDAARLRDRLLALDRSILERSLRIYNIPRHERLRIRARMGRLHKVVRAIELDPRKLAARNAWR